MMVAILVAKQLPIIGRPTHSSAEAHSFTDETRTKEMYHAHTPKILQAQHS